MPKRPAYFDSQAAAAAALNIEIDDIREAKREGCPAFRSGRVYGKELLSWLETRALQNNGSTKLNGSGLEKGRSVIDRKSTRLNSSHQIISYAVFCLKKKK